MKKTKKNLNEDEKLKSYELTEKTLNKIFEILPLGLWYADEKGKLIKGNPAGIKIWGAEPKVPPSEYGVFKARHHPTGKEIKPKEWALYKTITQKKTITNELIEIDAFDGKTKIISNYTAPIMNKKKLLGAIVVNQDITEQEKTKQELEKTKQFYEETISTLKEGIWVTNKEDKIIFFSEGMEKISDVTTTKAIGLHIIKDFPEKTTKEFLPYYKKAKKTLKPQYYEALVITPKKETYQTGWLIPKTKNKKYDGMICTIIDETEKHKTQEQLKKSEEEKKKQIELQKTAINITSKYVKTTLKDFDKTINTTLTNLGKSLNMDRSYIFRFNKDMTYMTNTHEWCNKQTKPQINNLQNVKTSTMPLWLKKIKTKQPTNIKDVDKLPLQARKEKKIFKKQQIKSLICVPIINKYEEIYGFLGLDSVNKKHEFTKEQIFILKLITEFLSNLIEKKITEESLEASEKKFENIFNNSPEGIILINGKGKILELNNRLIKWLKYEENELKEKNIFLTKILNLKNKKTFYKFLRKTCLETEAEKQQLEFITKNKTTFLSEISCGILEKNPKKWKGIIFVKNLEQDKKIKKDMIYLQRKFLSMVEKASESIVITNVNGSIEYVNPYFEKITGYALKEVLGKNPNILKSGKQSKEFYEEMWRTISEGKIWQGEITNKRKNGEEYIERVTITPLFDEEKNIINYIAMKYDITNLKEYEYELKKHIKELEDFKDATVDRELKMIELEKENKELKKQLKK